MSKIGGWDNFYAIALDGARNGSADTEICATHIGIRIRWGDPNDSLPPGTLRFFRSADRREGVPERMQAELTVTQRVGDLQCCGHLLSIGDPNSRWPCAYYGMRTPDSFVRVCLELGPLVAGP